MLQSFHHLLLWYLGLNFLKKRTGVFVVVQFTGHGQVFGCLLPVTKQPVQTETHIQKNGTPFATRYILCDKMDVLFGPHRVVICPWTQSLEQEMTARAELRDEK